MGPTLIHLAFDEFVWLWRVGKAAPGNATRDAEAGDVVRLLYRALFKWEVPHIAQARGKECLACDGWRRCANAVSRVLSSIPQMHAMLIPRGTQTDGWAVVHTVWRTDA